jgi:DNA-directed RNA polymerase subunit RPC12/RpoP
MDGEHPTPFNPFAHALQPYPCPACGRRRMPGEGDGAVCARCGTELALSDALRLRAHALREHGFYRLRDAPREAERLLRASLLLEPHPATRNGLALAAARLGNPDPFLALARAEALSRGSSPGPRDADV